ncbi:MAG: peptidoglycan hydrolase FlgJ [Clostridia bacterium]|jgi:flagellar protein FlgJ|nr:peptidoglycan hydrolase FlgJ [Clostridia bacterium]
MRIELNQNLNKLVLENSKLKNSENKFEAILNKVKNNEEDDKKLKEACQQFESIFINHMISRMRATIPEGGLFGKSQGEEIFQDMLDEKYAEKISEAGGIGLAEILYEQLADKNVNNAEKPPTKEQKKNE